MSMRSKSSSAVSLLNRVWYLALFGSLIACSSNTTTADVPVAAKAAAVESTHPLDKALQAAREGLDYMKENVKDYTCTIVKRERIKEELGEYQYMSAKIRHRQEKGGQVEVPFSVYLNFLKPKSVEGREVIWVEGRNDNHLIAHEAGLLNFKRVSLDPNGFMAMLGQRYPITEIGAQNLVEELIARGERDRKYGECDVQFFEKASINKRPCRMIQVLHPQRRDYFDFYKAEVYIDRELRIPVRYAAWSWPEKPGGEPVLLEEYTYLDVKVNVGLTDKDFDPDNQAYNYPRL